MYVIIYDETTKKNESIKSDALLLKRSYNKMFKKLRYSLLVNIILIIWMAMVFYSEYYCL